MASSDPRPIPVRLGSAAPLGPELTAELDALLQEALLAREAIQTRRTAAATRSSARSITPNELDPLVPAHLRHLEETEA